MPTLPAYHPPRNNGNGVHSRAHASKCPHARNYLPSRLITGISSASKFIGRLRFTPSPN